MGFSLELFSELVSGIYDAALDAALWKQTLSNLVAAFDGDCGALLVNSRQSCQALHASVGQDHESVASYNAYYGRMDPFASAVERMLPGRIFRGWDIVSPSEQRRSEFFNDWAEPNGIGDCIFATLVREGESVAWLGIGAPFRKEPFAGPEKKRLLGLLVPHLQQAMGVQLKLGSIEHQRCAALGAYNRLAHGVVLFGGSGSILFVNGAAARIAASHDGLTIGRSDIRAALANEDAVLQRLIGRANGKEDCIRAGGTLALTRPSARQSFVVHVLPTNMGDQESPMSGVLVVIVDPEREPQASAPMLRHVYGLTRAEATVACEVSRGQGLQSVADSMSITLSTVRVHLQRVFEKTHTRRQAELARLLLTIEAAVETSDGLHRESTGGGWDSGR